MHTGCVGPFCHGKGGWCGCNCKCCPPPCCRVISVHFQCGAAFSDANPQGCVFTTPSCTPSIIPSLTAFPPIPEFELKPILSEDKEFSLGSFALACSIPCETVCVEVRCGGGRPCCCLELLHGKIIAVGNGFVTAHPTNISFPECGDLTVLINGQPPPVFVRDCQEVKVTVQTGDSGSPEQCCCCEQIDIQCGHCPDTERKPLWKRKIDPRKGEVGKTVIYIDKRELLNRILNRGNRLKRRKK